MSIGIGIAWTAEASLIAIYNDAGTIWASIDDFLLRAAVFLKSSVIARRILEMRKKSEVNEIHA